MAGSGKLPLAFAAVAKKKGDDVIAIGLKGVTDSSLTEAVCKIHWLDWGTLNKVFILLVTERIRKVVMLGKIDKSSLFKNRESLDDKARELFKKIDGKRDYSVLKGVSDLFGKLGVEVVDPTTYLESLIPQKGLLTKRGPSEKEWEDIRYGLEIAKALSGFDIGQTVVVKDRTIIALESVEGTDETISRAGRLVDGGFSVVKVARPNQDMRFDVPLVGVDTVKTLLSSGGRVIALEEKKTFLVDREEIVRLADENGISVVIV